MFEKTEFGVLGPLTFRSTLASEMSIPPKPRQVIALLAVNANQIVPASTLIRELWDERPPRSALTAVQTYVLQLRKWLGSALRVPSAEVSRTLLTTHVGGYMLKVRDGELDLHGYEQEVADGRHCLDSDDNEAAAGHFRKALGVWRGPALVDVAAGPLLGAQVLRLEESRLTVHEQCIEAELRLGRHHSLLSELIELTGLHPMNENLHGQLMFALYRCGRRFGALEVFRHLRESLIGELGLEPAPGVSRLHRAILASDPALDVPPRGQAMLLDWFSRAHQPAAFANRP